MIVAVAEGEQEVLLIINALHTAADHETDPKIVRRLRRHADTLQDTLDAITRRQAPR